MQKSATHTVAVLPRGSCGEVSGLVSSGISIVHTIPHCSPERAGGNDGFQLIEEIHRRQSVGHLLEYVPSFSFWYLVTFL